MNNLIIEIISSFFVVIFTLWSTHFLLKKEKYRKVIKNNKIFHPNYISYFRVPLWFIAIVLFHYEFHLISIILFTFAAITDAIDWMIARACNLTTELWKSLDPLADKLVYFAPLIYFWIIWKINLYLVITFVIIDTLGQFSRILLKKLKLETSANSYWKFKTTFVFILIYYLMILENKNLFEIDIIYNNILMIFWLIFAILSIVFKFIPNNKK